jgi:ankyrin repeat protein
MPQSRIPLYHFQGFGEMDAACREGDVIVVRAHVELGADPRTPTASGWTPMHTAAKCGHEYVVRALVELRADPRVSDKYGVTPVFIASYHGHEAVVRTLVELGADPGIPYHGTTPIQIASRLGHEAVVRALVELGVDPHVPNDSGVTPIFAACFRGQETVVRALVELGVDPSSVGEYGLNPLDTTTTLGFGPLTRTLRILVAERGSGVCLAQDFADASWLSPLRRFVLGARLCLRVDCPSLVDAAILSLVEAAARERTTPTASLAACLPRHLRERVIRQLEDRALAASVPLWRAHVTRERRGVE